jgi:cold shock CspA family protein
MTEQATTRREVGTVLRYFTNRPPNEFGFIQPDVGGIDIFVSETAVKTAGLGPLKPGDRVSYEVRQSRRSGKPQAWFLQLIEK